MNRADYTLLGIAVVASLLILVPIIASAEAQVVQNATIPFTYSNNGTTINQPAFINATGTWLISDYMENEWRPAPYVPPTTTTSTSSSTPTSSVPYNPPQPPTPTIIYDDTDEYYLYDGFIKQLAKRTTIGNNYDLVEDYITGEATWTSTIEKIQDGFTVREDGTGVPTWKNYVLDQSGNKIIFNSNQIGGFVYDEPSCSYSIKGNGFNGNTVIPSVSAVATGLVNGEWVNLSVNNESCVVYVTSDADGIVITSTKTNNETTFTQVLDVNVNTGIKETWKVTNDDNTQLGISQTVHTGPSIEVGEQVIDIQALSGQSFDRQYIIDNRVEILRIAEQFSYDFDEGIDSLTGVNIIYDTNYKVNLDYASGNFVNYLEIDPTILSTSHHENYYSQGTYGGCSNSFHAGNYGGDPQLATHHNGSCKIASLEYDISTVPVVTTAEWQFTTTGSSGYTDDCTLVALAGAPSTTADSTTWSGIYNDPVIESGWSCIDTSGTIDVTTEVQAGMASGSWYAGLRFDTMAATVGSLSFTSYDLVITYPIPAIAADPPTNVVATSGLPIGITWTAPSYFGADTSGTALTSLDGYSVARTQSETSLTELPDNSGTNAGLDFSDNEFLVHGFTIIQGTTPTYENDFSTDNMVDQNSAKIGISNNVLDVDGDRSVCSSTNSHNK